MTNSSLKVKLVIDKTANRVLFAEAGKEFVDFIFHILSLPVGALTRVVHELDESGTLTMPGCFGRLYEGMKDLDDQYVDPTVKDRLLKPKAPYCGSTPVGLLPEASLSGKRVFRRCRRNTDAVTVSFSDVNEHHCWSCGIYCNSVAQVTIYGPPSDVVGARGGDEGGYVKGPAVFMVMDDLVVKPMSTVSALSLMGPEDRVGNFENQEVDFTKVEAMKLLKATLQSKTVLTDVFLKENGELKNKRTHGQKKEKKRVSLKRGRKGRKLKNV